VPEYHDPLRPTPEQAAEMRRRRRGRNIAMIIVLFALAALFYAITVVTFAPSPPLCRPFGSFLHAREQSAARRPDPGHEAKVLELPRDFAMMRHPRRGGFPGRTTMDSA
jgi:hypothetical protein